MNVYRSILVLTSLLCNLSTTRGKNVTGPYKDLTVGLNETHIYSPGYEEGRDYWENMTRDYRLTTYYVNHTLVLTMHYFLLEVEDKNQDCLYDKLTIYDGYNESYPVLKTICDNKTGAQLQTTGNVVYLIFTTDHDHNYRGFDIGVRSDGPISTIRTTTTSTTPRTPKTTWSSASTASTTVKTTSSSSTTLTSMTTTSAAKPDTDDKSKIFIIVGAAVGGLLLLILLLVLIICLVKKKKRPKSAVSAESTAKRVLWSRGGTKVQKIDLAKTDVPPGEVIQTNIFDMDLPTGQGKANLLPSISAKLPE